ITTDTIDRDGEVVIPSGIDLTFYRRSPVVMWSHKYDLPPIAKNLWVKQDAHGLLAETQFATTERGREAWELYKGGFLSGWSIGFLPSRESGYYGPPSQKELAERPDRRGAKAIVRKSELVEYSAAPIPCNPTALSRAIQNGVLNMSAKTLEELGVKPGAR